MPDYYYLMLTVQQQAIPYCVSLSSAEADFECVTAETPKQEKRKIVNQCENYHSNPNKVVDDESAFCHLSLTTRTFQHRQLHIGSDSAGHSLQNKHARQQTAGWSHPGSLHLISARLHLQVRRHGGGWNSKRETRRRALATGPGAHSRRRDLKHFVGLIAQQKTPVV